MTLQHNISVFYFALSLLITVPLTYADNGVPETPRMSENEKVTVTTEHIGEEKQKDKNIDVYKTTVHREIEKIILEPKVISPLEGITVDEPKTYQVTSFYEYETVVMTAKRSPSDPKQTAEDVRVISKEEIEQLPARDLGEVLSYLPGIDVQLNGQFGQSTSLSINGSPSRQVLLLVDGIPFNTQLSGQANPAQIPLENIERIELILGASSSAWGSSLGGVVNVITQDVGHSTKPEGNFKNAFAEFSTTDNSLDLAGKAGPLGYFVSGSYFNTDGSSDTTDAEKKNAFGKMAYQLGEGTQLIGSFGYGGAHIRYGTTPIGTVTSQPYNTRYGKLLLDIDTPGLKWNVAYKYNDQDITTDITGALTSSTVSTNVYHGVSLNNSWELFEDHLLVLGADFDWYNLKSNRYLNSSQQIGMQAPYVNYTLPWERWDFVAGMRYDHNQRFGSQASPSFGTVYHFEDSRQTLFRTKISRAFNAPPLLWIFNNDPSQFVGPNPDLKAERAIVYEAGMESRIFPSVDAALSLYRADVKDAIALVFDPVPFVFVQRNFKKFTRQGGELRLDYHVTDDVTFYGSGAFNDVENRATKEIVRDQGIARQRFTFGTRYHNEQGWGVSLSGSYRRWSSDPSLQPNDRKPIFDLKVTKEFKEIRNNLDAEIFLTVHNLTNSKYWSSIAFPLAERYFEGGFSVHF